MARILITGATGFIGSNLARSLVKDNEVFLLTRNPVNHVYINDIESEAHILEYDGTYTSMIQAVQVAAPETVYHLAAFYISEHKAEQVESLFESNIKLGMHLLEAMHQCKIKKLIYTSTSQRYYGNKEYHPLNLYAATKKSFEDILTYYIETEKISAITITLSDTYGKGDLRPKILNKIKSILDTEEVLEMSDGLQEYDAVYIEDVVSGLCHASELLKEKQESNSYRISAKPIYTLRETVEVMESVSGKKAPIVWGARKGNVREIRESITVDPILPQWKSKVTLREGIRRFMEK